MVNGTIDRCRQVESRRTRLAAGGAATGTTLDDAELGRRFRDGDPDAVGELVRRFSGPLSTVALRHLVEAELRRGAADVPAGVAGGGPLRRRPAAGPWLFQICRRVCIDLLRAQRVRTSCRCR
jgi:hypothetical protein